jgi:Putative prokaryotic signal transducing protein
MVEVGTYFTRLEAQLAQGALAAAGIRSVVTFDDASGVFPFDASGGIRLLVDEVDVDDATALLYD